MRFYWFIKITLIMDISACFLIFKEDITVDVSASFQKEKSKKDRKTKHNKNLQVKNQNWYFIVHNVLGLGGNNTILNVFLKLAERASCILYKERSFM